MKKILFLISLFCCFSVVNAKTYKIEQVTAEDQINNSTINDYIIVNHADNGNYYAWSSTLLSGTNSKRAQAKENAELVTFNDDFTELTVESDNNILWTFGLSAKSVSQGLDRVTLVSREDVFDDENSNKNQIAFSSTDTKTNPAGLTYTNDAYALDFKFLNDEGNVRIIYEDVKNNRTYYVRFLSTDNRFLAGDLGKASKKIKIYKVIDEYEKVKGFENNSSGKLDFSKTKEQDETFKTTGVYKINLSMKSEPLLKDSDIMFVLDISNSMDFDDKMEQLKMNANYLADSLLKMNSNNRIGVVKFADGNLLVDESYELGLSNDLIDIQDLINEDVDDKLGGTNYTGAFDLAYEILKENEESGREQVVIFITDGAPTIYNKTKFSVFKNTDDGIVGEYAENWSNYFLNNKLGNLEKMKDAGIGVFTIGVNIDEDMAIKSDGSFVVKSESAITLLKRMATSEEYFFKVDDYENLGETFDEIYSSLRLYLTQAVVNDSIVNNYKLVVEKYEGKTPYVEIKNESGLVVERVEFSADGTKAYSSLNPDSNIIVKEENGMVLGATYFSYNFDTKELVWNVDEVTEDTISLTYFIKPEKEQDSYEDDQNAISNKVVIDYKDYDIEEKQLVVETPYIEEEKNPNTVSTNITLLIIVFIISLCIGIISINKKRWLCK